VTEWIKPGAHVSSVGYYPPNGELPKDLTREHRLFVETLLFSRKTRSRHVLEQDND
jgi:ornithine cyclodeaminase/alanine dehydrogenase-like protein (mu-crystallin family)